MILKYEIGDIIFDDWKIVRRIGSGASGDVYEIQKQGITLSSAMKVMHVPQDRSLVAELYHDGMNDQSITSYLQGVVDELNDEIKIMVSLKGFPYIVNCEDYKVMKNEQSTEWDILIRMELLTPLQDYLMEHDLSEDDVRKIAIHLSKALELFDEHHLIHRDIKPENIFVNLYGDFKVGDFGIARAYDKATGGLSKKGTENYMAPEVYRGEDYDNTTDIYSLGLVLYKLLNNNRLPFYPIEGTYSEEDRRRAKDDRMSGKEKLQPPVNASEAFGQVILKMCSFDPSKRYASASELSDALSKLETSDKVVLHKLGGKAESKDSFWDNPEPEKENLTSPFFSGKTGRPKPKISDDASEEEDSEEKDAKGVSAVFREAGNAEIRKDKKSSMDSDKKETERAEGETKSTKKKGGSSGHRSKKENRRWLFQGIAIVAVLIAVCVPLFLSREYQVEVTRGSGSGQYKGGAAVTVKSEEIAGSSFAGWNFTGINLSEEDKRSEKLTFKMPRKKVTLEAIYEKNLYEVVVSGGTGSGEYALDDEVIIEADTPARGMVFDGWKINSGSISLSDPSSVKTSFAMKEEKVEITASYTESSYSLLVNGADGTGDIKFGSTVKLTAKEPDHYSFEKWEVISGNLDVTDEELNGDSIEFSMPAEDVEITANYILNNHTVEVTSGNGSGAYDYGAKVSIVADEAQTGKEFREWVVEDGEVKLRDKNSKTTNFVMPDEDVAITASYKDILYTLSVKGADGSGSYVYDEEITLTADEVEDHTFKKWMVNDAITVDDESLFKNTLTFHMPAADVDISAEYDLDQYSVTVNNGSGGGQYPIGKKVDIVANRADTGKEFKEWVVEEGEVRFTDKNAEKTRFLMPDEDVEISATYSDIPYQLTVDGADGSGQYIYGETVKLQADKVAAYTFDKWSIADDAVDLGIDLTASEISFLMPAMDFEIEATYKRNKHKVTVHNGTGGGTYEVGTKVSISAGAAQTGEKFAGWTLSEEVDGVNLSDAARTSFVMPDSDVDITAVYEKIAYKLSVNNGTGAGEYTMGEMVTVTAMAAQNDMRFSGWTIDSGDLSLSDLNMLSISFEMPPADLTMTAHYAMQKYTVRVYGGKGGGMFSAGSSVTVTADEQNAAGNPFVRWNIESGDLDDKLDLTERTLTFVMPAENVTLSAVYGVTANRQTEAEQKYKLVVNGGTGGGYYAAGDTITVSHDAPQSGMKFANWIIIQTGAQMSTSSDDVLSITMPEADLIVTAVFEQ